MRKAFTLIELLVVIAIIAVLAVVVVLTLNPGQLILQSRDSTRLSDLASLQSAISLYQTDAAINGSVRLGSSSVIYVSIPDPAATTTLGTTCSTMGLPALPNGYTYHCAASSTFRKVDGTGWIPVNLSSITSGAPLGQLPIDPTNASSSRSYLTYTTNGTQYELTSQIESTKYKLGGSNDTASSDGGTQASLYEKGTNLTLEPLDYGDSSLLGYWTFDEGTGTVAYDYSGNNATGSWCCGGAAYAVGKVGPYTGQFNGAAAHPVIPWGIPINTFTLSMWIYATSWNGAYTQPLFSNDVYPTQGFRFGANNINKLIFWTSEDAGSIGLVAPTALSTTTWYHVAVTYDGVNAKLYTNGSLSASTTGTMVVSTSTLSIGFVGGYSVWNGYIDDVRIYNRTFSASEVQALYNSQR